MKAEAMPSVDPREEQKPDLVVLPSVEEDAKMSGQTVEGNIETSQVETGKKTEEVLGTENRSFFSRMSEGAKGLAGKFYDKLYEIPGVNRVVGKMEIAYNQFWIDRHEEKATGLKGKIDGLDARVGTLDQSRQEIQASIEQFKRDGFPGVPSLELKLKEIERRKAGLQNERDTAQAKIDARGNKAELYAGKRDEIADRLISRYDEKLRPMEAELEILQTSRDEAELLTAVTEVKHREQTKRFSAMEQSKLRLESVLRAAGESERKIRSFSAIKELEASLARGRASIKKESEALAKKRIAINEKIAKTEAKAHPYRNKRKEFERVKAGRPLGEKEESRVQQPEGTQAGPGFSTAGSGNKEAAGFESNEAQEEEVKFTARGYVSGWNDYLMKEMGRKQASSEMLDTGQFEKTTKLRGSFELTPMDFKRILRGYLKVKKMPTKGFDRHIDSFLEGIMDAAKQTA